ncbi:MULTISPECIES: hypothetical protein [unclassified Streptomyces]|uniref:hypothetical protein n=1 Tax=unclassified Streptomyces TaxID=2593676 RepID=UPI0013698D3C|nr:hypothetical protein [Streptomyces sp. SHP 1-2]MCW5249903.1 hypothetical protein [Streptomyces sp. SHP 1-2]MYU22400.1 hypothetical protein [Streptomyces sp. SID8352]
MPPRLRSALSALLTVLACLLAPCGALAAWAAYGLADTGRYVSAMAPLATDPDVRDAVADTMGEGVLAQVGAVPAHEAVRLFVHDAARSFTRTDAFRAGWDAANRTLHDTVLDALRDDRAAGRPVTLDLAPVTARVRDALAEDHVSLARRIPVRHTAFTVLPAHEVDRLRKGYQVLDVAAFWLPLAAVVFAATGIAVAAHRRRAVAATGLGTAAGGGLLALAVLAGRRLTLAGLPGAVDGPAAGAVYDALTATLRTASWLLVALGLTVALASWLTGRRGRAPRHRPPAAPPGPGPAPARPTRARL